MFLPFRMCIIGVCVFMLAVAGRLTVCVCVFCVHTVCFQPFFFLIFHNFSPQLFVFSLLFFHSDSFLSVLQSVIQRVGNLPSSRSVLELSRWFHFIAQKEKQDNGLATSFSNSHSPYLKIPWKGNNNRKKRVKKKTIQELKCTPFLTFTRPQKMCVHTVARE